MSDYLPVRPGSGAQPRVVLDTDTFNEIDDQFALAYLLRAVDKVETEAIYAAPYSGRTATSAAEGMQKSYEEIQRLLNRLALTDFPAFRGSAKFLSDEKKPVESDAAADLAERAMTATHSDRLTVIAIGALTNVASALLAEPDMSERCTVVWLGGHHPAWPHNDEFNLQGDIAAARAVFDSGAPLYVVPCNGVASHLTTSRYELEAHLDLAEPVSEFLHSRFSELVTGEVVHSKVIWDIAAIAWLVLPQSIESYSLATPRIAADGSYIHDQRRPPCRFAYSVDRDAIFADLFARLASDVAAAGPTGGADV